MAAEGKTSCHKPLTITFTLPISCQICLGKVKQPVLCPNHHVFCSLCLDIWLNRNKQCPACRVDIGPENPVKHIIGSPLEEENSESNSTPQFRRARFDLLYREYEDELEKLQKDNIILKMQNSILTTQLQDVDPKNAVSEDSKKALIPYPSPQTPDGPRLLQLSRNLQEVSKLYQVIRTEMAELKQENCKLKDESVNLTRENENLRLEIAQRSPKKFGRYTVATLEAKLAEQEKEIRQLKKALERSDGYIEELQHQQDRRARRFDPENPGTNSRFQINLEPKRSSAEEDNSTDRDGPRKVLFGKVVREEAVKPSNVVNVFTALGTGKSLQKLHGDRIFSKRHEFLAPGDADSPHLQQKRDRNEPASSGHSEAANKSAIDLEESVEVSSQASLPSQPDSKETSSGIIPDKTSKKVHFKDCGTASFELEAPSPISSLINETFSSASKDLSSPPQKSALESEPSPGYKCQFKMELLPLEGEDEYDRRFLDKNVASSRDLKVSQTLRKEKTSRRKKLKVKAKKMKQEPEQETMEDSSHLSLPDVTPPDTIDNFSDDTGVSGHVTDDTGVSDDFDMSMTPEMTDCLRLINQAEKKVSTMASTAVVLVPKPDFMIGPVHHAQQSSGPPDSSTFFERTSTATFPTTDISSGQRFDSAGSNIKGWQQQFYSALKVNPQRVGTVYKTPDYPIASSHYPLSSDHLGSGSKQKLYSLMDYKPSKDFTFSEPIRVTTASTDLHDNAIGRTQSSLANPLTSVLSVPGTSSSSSTFPSPSAFNFMTPSDIHKDSYHHSSSTLSSVAPSTHSHTHSYVAQNGRHTGS